MTIMGSRGVGWDSRWIGQLAGVWDECFETTGERSAFRSNLVFNPNARSFRTQLAIHTARCFDYAPSMSSAHVFAQKVRPAQPKNNH
jgi:hypothetical protein